jgi:hypothetical protein
MIGLALVLRDLVQRRRQLGSLMRLIAVRSFCGSRTFLHFHPLQLVACGRGRSSQKLTGSEDSKPGALGAMTALGTHRTSRRMSVMSAVGVSDIQRREDNVR